MNIKIKKSCSKCKRVKGTSMYFKMHLIGALLNVPVLDVILCCKVANVLFCFY